MRAFQQILLALTISSTPGALAAVGPGSSGGGDAVISTFIATAYAVIEKAPFTGEHRALLYQALRDSKFKMVDQLMDPASDFTRPVADQDTLVAFGSPGVVQIKKRSDLRPNDRTIESLSLGGDAIGHYAIHELFRASGAVGADQRSIDDNFELSITTYHLDKMETRELIENWFACAIDGSSRKHVLSADSYADAERLAAERLTKSNLRAGWTKGVIAPSAAHCMRLNGIMSLAKLREAFGGEAFENVELATDYRARD